MKSKYIQKIVFLLCFVVFLGCKPEPGTYIKQRCIKEEYKVVYEMHYGHSYRGKFEMFYGPVGKTICSEYVTDTIVIK